MSNDKTPDIELIRLLKGGSYAAFKVLYSKYSKSIYLTARKFHLTHENAENIVQDVFLKVWEKRHNLKTEYSFYSYLYTIAKNDIFKQLKKKIFISLKEEYQWKNPLVSPSRVEGKLLRDDFKVRYRDTIRKLTPIKKRIFILRFHLGLSNQEIADRMGLSKRTVENHIQQIKVIIRKHLGKEYQSIYISLILCFQILYEAISSAI